MTQAQRKTALALARESIRTYLDSGAYITYPDESPFNEEGAAFVTLHTRPGHQLRGCIGSIIAHRPLGEDIVRHAVDAAVGDPRFPAMEAEELERVGIEISILSAPRPLEYAHSDDLLAKLRPGIDGVVIRYGGNGATYLPTVWEQIPDPKLFMEYLCQKAGLPATFYTTGKLSVLIYESEVFSEEE